MAARSTASVSISFGLVNIPVDVYPAEVASNRISFNLLHASDGARVKQQYVCALDGEVVPRSEMVKGYEYEKDRYVMFKPEEIKALEEAGTKLVNITGFVPLDTVDPVFFDRTYLLAPSRHGAKPYALLNEAMHQLHFKDEVRTMSELPMGETPQLAAGELKLAKALIEQTTGKRFDPDQFHDEFRARVEAAIEKKVRSGKEISHFAEAESDVAAGGNVVDLMEILQRSLKRSGGGSSRSAGGKGDAPGSRATARKPPRRVTEPGRKKRAAPAPRSA